MLHHLLHQPEESGPDQGLLEQLGLLVELAVVVAAMEVPMEWLAELVPLADREQHYRIDPKRDQLKVGIKRVVI